MTTFTEYQLQPLMPIFLGGRQLSPQFGGMLRDDENGSVEQHINQLINKYGSRLMRVMRDGRTVYEQHEEVLRHA